MLWRPIAILGKIEAKTVVVGIEMNVFVIFYFLRSNRYRWVAIPIILNAIFIACICGFIVSITVQQSPFNVAFKKLIVVQQVFFFAVKRCYKIYRRWLKILHELVAEISVFRMLNPGLILDFSCMIRLSAA